jgi:L-ribulose-5-phosphate 4-epimerase
MERQEVETAYEANTGEVIASYLADSDPMELPAILVAGHGPFCWGPSPSEAAHNEAILEYTGISTICASRESLPTTASGKLDDMPKRIPGFHIV